ncbi:hypothetical protein TRAPUB_6900 [Trametes pubescens]|uniref:Uncharacterized protein n=1 Tax=Trametes pubescens TaxID=154538 RepID=A0A1M2V4S7_TRAPU|nr:hypothetical protein TRAPUB_6900 [Trametes pubescens]
MPTGVRSSLNVRFLERELVLCKLAMRTDPRITEKSQLDGYRSLWYLTHKRLKELEEVLIAHVDEDVVRIHLPFHQRFRS